jgi:hypothetical protein
MKIMSYRKKYIIIITALIVSVYSCSVIEKTSMHGFESDYYTFSSKGEGVKEVYADLSEQH